MVNDSCSFGQESWYFLYRGYSGCVESIRLQNVMRMKARDLVPTEIGELETRCDKASSLL